MRKRTKPFAIVPKTVLRMACVGVVPMVVAAGCGADSHTNRPAAAGQGAVGVPVGGAWIALAIGGFGGGIALATGGFGGGIALAVGGFGAQGSGGVGGTIDDDAGLDDDAG